MAKLVAVRNRGRRKEALRLQASEMAKTVTGGNPKEFTVEVVPPKRKGGKPETVTVIFPAGSVMIPVALTASKKEENAREQLRLAIEDAGRKGQVGIRSFTVETDAGETLVCWAYVARKPKDEPKAKGK